MTILKLLLAAALLNSLFILGCESGFPTDAEAPVQSRIGLDLTPLYRAVFDDEEFRCASVLARAVLAENKAGSKTILEERLLKGLGSGPGSTLFFNAELKVGRQLTAQIFSGNGVLLYEGAATITQRDFDQRTLFINLEKRAPVLQVCPELVTVDPRMRGTMRVTR